MAYLKYVPAAIYVLFISFALIGYSATGADAVLVLGLGTGFVLGSCADKTIESKVAHVELGKRLKHTRK